MASARRVTAILCLSSILGFAGTWSGTLVDSRCFDSEERNVNPTDTLTYVDRDTNRELRVCSPRARTKTFAVVQQDGTSFRLDSTGNAKAVELVRNLAKSSRVAVTVTGEMSGNTVQVASISIAK